MITVSKEAGFHTLINVFTVAPDDQQRLVDLLMPATESTVRKTTGFSSSSLHRSMDGTKVTRYAQWKSMEDYRNRHNNTTASHTWISTDLGKV